MPAAQVVDFEGYLARMKPWVLRVTGSSARGATHPYLSQPDLIQGGMIQLWNVWRKHSRTKPLEEVCRMGTTAVQRACLTAHSRARAFGAGGARVLSLDEPLGDGAKAMAEVVGEDGLETLAARFALDEVERVLPELERRLLWELMEPADATLRAMRRQWSRRRNAKQTWRSVREHVLAGQLGVPLPQLRLAWSRVKSQVRRVFDADGASHSDGYSVQAVAVDPYNGHKEGAMEHDTRGGGIDQMFPMEPGTPAAAPPEAGDQGGNDTVKEGESPKAAVKKKVTAVEPDTKAKVKPDTKKPAKVKPDTKKPDTKKPDTKKPDTKAVREPKKRKDVSDKKWDAKTAIERIDSGKYTPKPGEKLIPVGTAVVYQGGSKAAWLRKGDKGKVSRYYGNVGPGVRYGCRFKGRSTILGSQFIKAE